MKLMTFAGRRARANAAPIAALSMFAALAVTLPQAASGAPVTFEIDPVHSHVGFRVRHFVSKVPGQFNEFQGTIVYDEAAPAASSVQVTIATASIDTRNDRRDEHLRSPDFFDVATFPAMTYRSKSVKVADGKLTVEGDLTLRGVTKPVALSGEVAGMMPDPMGGTRAGFSAMAKINRKDFGVVWNKVLDQGGTLLGDEVEIMIEIEAVHQPPKAADAE